MIKRLKTVGNAKATLICSIIFLLPFFTYAQAGEAESKKGISDLQGASKGMESRDAVAINEPLAGSWQGALSIGNGMTLPLVFHFKKNGDSYEGSFDSPAQGSFGVKFDSVSFEKDGEAKAVIAKLQAYFEGVLDSKKSELQGRWVQGGQSLDLKLAFCQTAPVRYRRPQEPQAPFPYKVEEVKFKNGEIDLAGTLTYPSCSGSSGRHPAIVLLHGSGPHDRDETIFGHKPFLLLADFLTRNCNLAVLRYDKRGCAKSGGSYKVSKSTDFASDGRAAIAYLRSRPDIDPDKIGLLGHSEGGVLAPIIASDAANAVGFIVLLAASALPGDEILLYQVKALSEAGGDNPEKTSQNLKLARLSYEIVKSEKDDQRAIEKLKEMRKANAAPEYLESGAKSQEGQKAAASGLKVLVSPWYREFIEYDPRRVWKEVKCPVLAINGDRDLQVAADENLAAISDSLAQGKNKLLTVKKVAGVNHLMQNCKTGLPSEYATIEETISDSVLKIVHDWLNEILKPGSG